MNRKNEDNDELLQLRENFHRLFNLLSQTNSMGYSVFHPPHMELPVDMAYTDTELLVYVDVPGVSRDDLKVSVMRDIIIVEGKRNAPYPPAIRFQCMERIFDTFYRIIELPKPMDTTRISAKYINGVLCFRGPLIQERRGGKRPVDIEFSSEGD